MTIWKSAEKKVADEAIRSRQFSGDVPAGL